jgi:hypothetical protein
VVNLDFRDLFSALNAHDVRYLVVGAYAVTFHSRPRYTKDLDVWVDPTAGNAAATWNALAEFGAPVSELKADELSRPGIVVQIGVAPNRIDVLTSVEGLGFSDAFRRRVAGSYGGCPVHFLSREDLIANKRTVGRPQDLIDVKELERRTADDGH